MKENNELTRDNIAIDHDMEVDCDEGREIAVYADHAETKFQLCNNLACVLNSETEEEIEYKESLFDLVKDDAAVLSYAIHYLDDWLPDSAE